MRKLTGSGDQEPTGDYEVGYGKPPQHTRFRKGQSGNTKGRPKGSKNISTIIKDLLAQQVIVRHNGQKRRMSFREALIHKLAAKAIDGNTRDIIAMLKMIHEHLPNELEAEPVNRSIQVEFVTPDGEEFSTIEEYMEYRDRARSNSAEEGDLATGTTRTRHDADK